MRKYRKTYNKKNKEKLKEYHKNYFAEYYKNNKEKIIKQNSAYSDKKYKEDPFYRLKALYRSRLNSILKNRTARSETILGCSFKEFKKHIEDLFLPGMTWDKIGTEIHIDHIIPLYLAKTEEDLIILSSYVNLRPMWAKDNLKKSKNTII